MVSHCLYSYFYHHCYCYLPSCRVAWPSSPFFIFSLSCPLRSNEKTSCCFISTTNKTSFSLGSIKERLCSGRFLWRSVPTPPFSPMPHASGLEVGSNWDSLPFTAHSPKRLINKNVHCFAYPRLHIFTSRTTSKLYKKKTDFGGWNDGVLKYKGLGFRILAMSFGGKNMQAESR